jgi:hypothetical protein
MKWILGHELRRRIGLNFSREVRARSRPSSSVRQTSC